MEYMTLFERKSMERGLEEGRKKGLQEGLREGMLEGMREGQALLLMNMLRQRFGALPRPVEERVVHASTDELQAWSTVFVTASTLEEVFKAT